MKVLHCSKKNLHVGLSSSYYKIILYRFSHFFAVGCYACMQLNSRFYVRLCKNYVTLRVAFYFSPVYALFSLNNFHF